MSSRTQSLADTLVEVISPVLIVLVVGSLVCFITEVLYQGEFNLRLQFILCMFVMGTVSIARISMEEGATYASFFAAPLAMVTALALFRYVEFTGPLAGVGPVISLGLMAFIWWCTHQLTVDSTVLDRAQDSTGSGLLSQLGWEQAAAEKTTEPAAEVAEAVSDHSQPAEAVSQKPWWEKILAPDGWPHSHGMWALYFSLAAVPIFGIGQFFLGSGDLAARRWVFKLLVVYVASSLALLLSTSFLGLRRYLKKRKLDLPLEMAAGWLMIGGLLIGGLLLAAFALPRPMPEYSLAQLLPEIRAPQRSSSPRGMGKEGVQDKPQAQTGTGQKKTPDNPNSAGNFGQKTESGGSDNSQAQSGNQSNSDSSSGAQSGNQGNQGNESRGDKTAQTGKKKPANDSAQQQGDNSQQGNSGGDNSQGNQGNQSSPDKSSSGNENNNQTNSEPKPPENQQNNQPQDNQSKSSDNNSSPTQASSPPPPSNFNPAQTVTNLFGSLGDILNWLGMALMLAVAAFVGWKYRDQLLDAWKQLQQSWYDFLAKLFGWDRKPAAVTSSPATIKAPPPAPQPFASYSDPFATGDAQRWPLVRLVRHSFAALEAWGRERACERPEDQTPAEFAQNIAERQPAVATEVQQLAQLYGQVAYGPGVSASAAHQILQRFWQRVRAT